MLGRTASSLFWMSRYQERAQNTSKILETAYRSAMVPQSGQTENGEWLNALETAGAAAAYEFNIGEVSPKGVMNYLIFDRNNPSSVRVCIETARNNARAVRTAITSELWEAINTTHLEFADVNPQSLTPDKIPDFLAWISQRSHLFRGSLLNTTLRDDGYFFSQFGTFVERADNTARVLNTRYWVLLPDNDVIGDDDFERPQWSDILRTLSGKRSYRFAYPNAKLKAYNIAEFLILRKEMPRALAHCYDWIDDTAKDMAQFYDTTEVSLGLAEEIYSSLQKMTMREIFDIGLNDFLTEFRTRNNNFANQLSHDFNFA
ncbi:MAG: alpha-E domain-containing protein [Rhodobacteraceae bacterium]|nr:alpha-E domain-containing protein [Paracoccaceae bacterium]